MVHTPKIIPIPLFLVPFFINGGKTRTTIDTLQSFQQKFLLNASPELLQNTKYILHFLLAATSYDASQDITVQPPTSQLAIQMEALPFNPVLTHWATNQFVGLWQIADAKNKCTTTNQQNIITPTNTETNNNINHAGLTAAATTQPGTVPAQTHPLDHFQQTNILGCYQTTNTKA